MIAHNLPADDTEGHVKAKENMTKFLKDKSTSSVAEERRNSAIIMGRVAAGDALAMHEVVEQHLRASVSLAYRFLRDEQESQDVSQEAFLRLWRQASSWREEAKISTWLYRVTVNLCLDRLRKQKRKQTYELPESIVDTSNNPATTLEKKDEEKKHLQILERCLHKLSDHHRTVLTLFVFEKHSLKKTAMVMQISERAAESLLRRAREKISLLLHSEQGFSSLSFLA